MKITVWLLTMEDFHQGIFRQDGLGNPVNIHVKCYHITCINMSLHECNRSQGIIGIIINVTVAILA